MSRAIFQKIYHHALGNVLAMSEKYVFAHHINSGIRSLMNFKHAIYDVNREYSFYIFARTNMLVAEGFAFSTVSLVFASICSVLRPNHRIFLRLAAT